MRAESHQATFLRTHVVGLRMGASDYLASKVQGVVQGLASIRETRDERREARDKRQEIRDRLGLFYEKNAEEHSTVNGTMGWDGDSVLQASHQGFFKHI